MFQLSLQSVKTASSKRTFLVLSNQIDPLELKEIRLKISADELK